MYFEITSKRNIKRGLFELFQYKELLYSFVWKDIKIKYKQALLGFLWVILQPLIMMLIFTLFAKAVKIDSGGIPYPVFAFSGLIFWNIFASGVQSAGNSIVVNANIIKKIYFPRLIMPIASILVSLFDFVIAFVFLIGLLIYFGIPFDFLNIFCFIPIALIIAIIYSLGAGIWLASLNVKYRDFKYVIPFLIQLLFFASPVVYPSCLITNPLIKSFYYFNPYAGLLDIVRHAFFNSPIDFFNILISAFVALCILVIASFVFFRNENKFADIA